MCSTLIQFNTAGSHIALFPVGIVQACNAYAFGYRGVDKHMVAQKKTYVRNNLALGSTEKHQVTLTEIMFAAKGLYTAGKELLNRSARYFDMIHITQQPLDKSRAVDAPFIGAAPEVGGVQPPVYKSVQGQVLDTVCRNAGVGGVLLPQQLVAHRGAVHSCAGYCSGIAFQDNGVIAFGAFFLSAASGQHGSCYSKNIERFHIRVNS